MILEVHDSGYCGIWKEGWIVGWGEVGIGSASRLMFGRSCRGMIRAWGSYGLGLL